MTPEEKVNLALSGLPPDQLKSHYTWAKRRRRKFLTYGLNGSVVLVPRKIAVGVVAEKIKNLKRC